MPTNVAPDTSSDVLSLADILGSGVAVDWEDAVTLMQQVCASAAARGVRTRGFPNHSTVTLNGDGWVEITALFQEIDSVDGAGRMLGELLSGEVPAPLRTLVDDVGAGQRRFETLADFAVELAYFTRPDGRVLLADLHRRAREVTDWIDAAVGTPADPAPSATIRASMADEALVPHALPALTAATSSAALQAEPDSPHAAAAPAASDAQDDDEDRREAERQRRRQRRQRLRQHGIAAAAVAAVLVGGVAAYQVLPAGPAPRDLAARAARRVAGAASSAGSALERVTSTMGRTPARSSPAADAPATQARPKLTTRRPATAARPRNSPSSPGPAAAAVASVRPAPIAPAPRSALDTAATDGAFSAGQRVAPAALNLHDDMIYSARTPQVRPPVALRPQLPAEPADDVPQAQRCVITLVIAASGVVESVKLVGRPRTVKDVMLLAAAKSWIFSPATMNGRSVRYRYQLEVTVP
jgi:hypothetical protein